MLKITLESTLAFGVTLRVPHGHLWGPSGTLQILKQYQEILYIRVVLYASVMMKKNYPFHCFKLNHDMLQDKTARYLSVIMEIITGSPLAL